MERPMDFQDEITYLDDLTASRRVRVFGDQDSYIERAEAALA